jgi:hypothetical protein
MIGRSPLSRRAPLDSGQTLPQLMACAIATTRPQFPGRAAGGPWFRPRKIPMIVGMLQARIEAARIVPNLAHGRDLRGPGKTCPWARFAAGPAQGHLLHRPHLIAVVLDHPEAYLIMSKGHVTNTTCRPSPGRMGSAGAAHHRNRRGRSDAGWRNASHAERSNRGVAS